MKDCPRCGLVNPATALVCDCGYSFHTRTAQLVCPNCRATQGLRPLAPDGGTKALAILLGGLAGVALYNSQTNQFQCQNCGHSFRSFTGMGSRKPRVWEWLFGIAIFALGFCLLGVYTHSSLYGTTAEADLTQVEGIATDVSLSSDSGGTTNFLYFTVAGYRTEYGSDRPKYEEVLVAVQSGETVQVWVSTKQESLSARRGWVPLYKMSVGMKPILGYSEVVGYHEKGSVAFLIMSSVVVGIGACGVLFSFLCHRRYMKWGGTQP